MSNITSKLTDNTKRIFRIYAEYIQHNENGSGLSWIKTVFGKSKVTMRQVYRFSLRCVELQR